MNQLVIERNSIMSNLLSKKLYMYIHDDAMRVLLTVRYFFL